MHFLTKYATEETLANERLVRDLVQKAWRVELLERGQFDPIDWEVRRGNETVAVIELKNYKRTAFFEPTVILNVRKYIALRDWQKEHAKPALYMVNFFDEIRYIDSREVDIRFPVLGGQKNGPRSTDWEPVYKVPVSKMTLFAKKGNKNG